MIDRKALLEYVADQYGTEPEYLWASYPSYAVLRHNDNTKWYGIIMDVPREKLGLDGDGIVDILDVKLEPLEVDLYRGAPGFLPAYHMSKTNWITILLDGSVEDDLILELLHKSYDLTTTKQKKKRG